MPDSPTTQIETGTGVEWIVDAHGCNPALLCDLDLLITLCDQLVVDLNLCVIGHPQSHRFDDPGGVTALYMLSESHLAVHTYPEKSLATFNLYCCRARPSWDWQDQLERCLAATNITVQQIPRGRK